MKKKILAVMLAFTMVAGSTGTVWAAEEKEDAVGTEETAVEGVEEESSARDDIARDDTVQGDTAQDNIVQGDTLTETPENLESDLASVSTAAPDVTYRVHVQSYGWQSTKKNGESAGTTGEAKRLEAIELNISNSTYAGGIEYRTHVQSYGWQDWVSDGALSGTTGEAKRLEAIQIRLTGELKNQYDIYYRVHAQSYGWLGWAKNGEKAGTASYAKRLECIEVVLVEKNGQAPGETGGSYICPGVQYQTHVQEYGWQDWVSDGEMSGTSGEAKRLEGIRIHLYDTDRWGYDGGIEYQTHVQSYGWQDWVSDGEMSGTSGESKRLEAIRIRLTGELAEHYSVYYRVHSQSLGWLDWAKDGEASGTEGFSKRLEAIEIKVISKDSQENDMEGDESFVSLIPDENVTLFGTILIEDSEDNVIENNEVCVSGNGQVLGDAEGNHKLESFGIDLSTDGGSVPSGTILYRVKPYNGDWTAWTEQGGYAGDSDDEKYLQVIEVELAGNLEKLYHVYYRVCMETFGWLGWTADGEPAGMTGKKKGISAIQVQLVPRNQSGPGMEENAYREESEAAALCNPCPDGIVTSEFGGRDAPTDGASTNHKGRDYAAPEGTPIYAAATGVVIEVAENDARGKYLKIDHQNGLITLYQHCSVINVEKGDTVFVGAKIAEVGSTGIVTGAHLHFEVWEDGTPVDPRLYLSE